jgi:K+-sensing histidine kinase KdpD
MMRRASKYIAGEDDQQSAASQDDSASIAQLVSQINSRAEFAAVAHAILHAACQRGGAVEATLLAMESDTTSLLWASVRSSPLANDPYPDRAPTGEAGAYLSLPLHNSGHLVGLLNLYWVDEYRLLVEQQRELDTLANLAALLIQREYAQGVMAATSAKMRQFELHKEEFIHLVSHQLRTPLTSIKGFAQLLGRQQRAGNLEAIGRYGNTILQETNRLTTIVNNLMELSRMEVVMIGIRYAPFALNEVVEQALADAGKAQRIETSLDPGLPPCSGDRAVLKQALAVLVVHLLRANSQHISVSTTCSNGHLNIALALATDDWPQRSSDELHNISLSDAVDTIERPNPAMSLYIVRNLTEAMGGSFSLERISETQADHSSQLRYVVSLPLAQAQAAVMAGA